MPAEQRRALLAQVRVFDAFTDDSDPHGEHDFGAIDEGGVRCFWKIDLYDRATEMGSPDPADPAVITRVPTIMRADEYWPPTATRVGPPRGPRKPRDDSRRAPPLQGARSPRRWRPSI